jgi:uncharacterized membrane protein YbhN (UPF0104 family)
VSARLKRIAGLAIALGFFAVVAWLLGDELRALDPREIQAVLRELSPARLAIALGLTALCYAVLASYDRLASRLLRVRLPRARAYAIAFVSYAFNFNLGATVGAVGFRYRLYSRANVGTARIGAILACSIATNWCGCLAVLGALLVADPSALDFGWGLPAVAGRALGFAALLPVAGYLAAAWLRRAPIRIRGTEHPMPGPRFALAQIALGSAYWLLVPLIVYLLRPPGTAIGYSQIAVAYGIAAVGGIIVRVPAGLGVVEAVFLEIFRGRVGGGTVLGMLIAWRALFLLAPLAIAAIVLVVLESRGVARGRVASVRR